MTSCVEGVSVDNKHQEHIEHLAVLLLDDGLEGMVNLPVSSASASASSSASASAAAAVALACAEEHERLMRA